MVRCLTPEAARRLLDLRADQAAQDRIEELALASTERRLSPAQDETCVLAGSLLAVLQAKARSLLAARAGR